MTARLSPWWLVWMIRQVALIVAALDLIKQRAVLPDALDWVLTQVFVACSVPLDAGSHTKAF
jgi:hypothetical protein